MVKPVWYTGSQPTETQAQRKGFTLVALDAFIQYTTRTLMRTIGDPNKPNG